MTDVIAWQLSPQQLQWYFFDKITPGDIFLSMVANEGDDFANLGYLPKGRHIASTMLRMTKDDVLRSLGINGATLRTAETFPGANASMRYIVMIIAPDAEAAQQNKLPWDVANLR